MKKNVFLNAVLCFFAIPAFFIGTGFAAYANESPIDPCLECHTKETAGVVKQWETGKHSKTGVKCYVCHFGANGIEHNGFTVIKDVSVATCESCHPENGAMLRKKFSKKNAKHP